MADFENEERVADVECGEAEGGTAVGRIRIHQKDRNQDEIVDAFEQAGATVYVIGEPVDLLVGIGGVAGAVEVKTAKGQLEPKQEAFFEKFTGAKAIVRNVHDAIEFVQVLRKISRVGVWDGKN